MRTSREIRLKLCFFKNANILQSHPRLARRHTDRHDSLFGVIYSKKSTRLPARKKNGKVIPPPRQHGVRLPMLNVHVFSPSWCLAFAVENNEERRWSTTAKHPGTEHNL